MTERPSKSRAPALRLVLLATMAVLFTARFFIGARSRGAETLWDLFLALAILGVLMFLFLTVPASRARKAAGALRVARPDAVIVETYWGAGYTDFFLRPGPLMKHARGRGGRILLVADRRGIELVRPQGKFSFGLIPWNLVKEIRLEELNSPFASRPKLVFEIHGITTPFQDRFELLPTGKEERARAAQSLNAILATQPATHP
ncbi:hypothetical protein OOZ51_05385 [Arthrobacter sp. MI7-26]|uniref:hypothetical protein n=1 Tax=Arthrobacter sp. MI7-26 TaxID=2993653 RepID=UPI0022490484|nr:hypothetical protein [Arthrobacter sp. MI7-26]MCX2747248.1 hypothetical protein [Arthrobacter sp. MI7-26]